MLTFIVFIIIFGILVFIHELGHFIVAKNRGVKVEEFAFGFPPRIWSKKKGETVYAINAIPLGGYVKLFGENGEDEKKLGSFAGKSKADRVLILISGVIMNFLLAVLLLTIGYSTGMRGFVPGMGDHKGIINTQNVKITNVEKNSPAETEGLREGDEIKKVDGKNVFIDVEVITYINQKTSQDQNAKVSLEIKRNNETIARNIQTFEDTINKNDKEIPVRRIGIGIKNEGELRAPIFLAPWIAIKETARLSTLTFVGLIDLFKDLLTKFTLSEKVTGPVGIYKITGVFTDLGIKALVQFVAILSISLGVINIMPIPSLDGGHLLVLVLEKVFKKEFSAKTKGIVTAAGFTMLILLIIGLTIRDIVRF